MKEVDFTPFIGKGVTEALLNKDYFRKAGIESGGGLFWPNGYDFCPNFLKTYLPLEKLEKKTSPPKSV